MIVQHGVGAYLVPIFVFASDTIRAVRRDLQGSTLFRLTLALFGGVPLFIVAATLLLIWLEPRTVADGQWLKLAAMMILIEFLLLHSGAFMAVGPVVCRKPWQQVAWFSAFTAFYGLFFAGVSAYIGRTQVGWMLAAVLLSRLLTLILLRDRRGTILMLQRSAVGMVILLLTMFICLIPFPDLGISEALRAEAFGPAEDALSEHPERFIAWGLAYFLIMGAIELWAGWRLPGWKDEEVAESWRQLRQGS